MAWLVCLFVFIVNETKLDNQPQCRSLEGAQMQWAGGKGVAHVIRDLHHPHFTNNPALPRLLQAPSTATKELN
jgi:hypothetical protein